MSKIAITTILLLSALLNTNFAKVYRVHEVIKIVDGDTVDVMIDLGLDTYVVHRLRLLGIDAWEVTGSEKEKGLKAEVFVTALLAKGEVIEIDVPDKWRGKYGRTLAVLIVDGVSVNDELVKYGHAEVNFYE